MNPDLILLAMVDGMSYGALLFLVSLGLTLIFGVFGVINVVHGSFYAFGGYAAATMVIWLGQLTDSALPLLLALMAVALIVGGILGAATDVFLLRPFQGKDPVIQLLVTFAGFMILEDVQRMLWGPAPHSASEVASRLGTTEILGVSFMNYQLLFVPAIALVAFFGLQHLLRHSVAGKKIVAVMHHREVAVTLGINANRTGLATLILGGALGGLGGALSVPATSFTAGVGAEIIATSFAVVATAGLGQIRGAAVAALLIGVTRSMSLYLLPEVEVVMPYLIMVLVLLVKPNGMFSAPVARRI